MIHTFLISALGSHAMRRDFRNTINEKVKEFEEAYSVVETSRQVRICSCEDIIFFVVTSTFEKNEKN